MKLWIYRCRVHKSHSTEQEISFCQPPTPNERRWLARPVVLGRRSQWAARGEDFMILAWIVLTQCSPLQRVTDVGHISTNRLTLPHTVNVSALPNLCHWACDSLATSDAKLMRFDWLIDWRQLCTVLASIACYAVARSSLNGPTLARAYPHSAACCSVFTTVSRILLKF